MQKVKCKLKVLKTYLKSLMFETVCVASKVLYGFSLHILRAQQSTALQSEILRALNLKN